MANIKPFKDIVYNSKKILNLSKVIAPPYDIIPERLQNELYRASPYNVVRLELGKIKGSDTSDDNRYTRAKHDFDSWLKSSFLTRDDKDSIYVYSQRYKDGDRYIDRIGFIALMCLNEGRKKVLPHENTLLAPKIDRLNLIREIRANLSPIFVLYEDVEHAILKILNNVCLAEKPFIDIYFEGIRNRAWRLSDEKAIKKIQSIMRNANAFIADGHHRFEVSRMYHKELKAQDAPDALKDSSAHIMVFFVEAKEDMLTVLPAHRLIRDVGALKEEEMIERLRKFFMVEKTSSLDTMMSKLDKLRDGHIFGMYNALHQFYILELKSMKPVDAAIKNKPKDWKALDVSILHLFILQYVLGVRDDDDNIEFVKSPWETAKFIDDGDFKIAFFLNPTKVAQVKKIASLGEKMPRKATYFYPKPVSGIVINKLD